MKTLMIVRLGMIAGLCPRLAWFLGLMLLAGQSGCGPAPSDHAPNPESRASLGAPAKSRPVLQGTAVPLNGPFALAASPSSNNVAGPAAQEALAPMPEQLVLPTWIAQDLDAPEVSVRLQALDMWARQGAQAPLDPLVVALDDEDDDVRAKAIAIIERNWAVEQEAEPEAKK
jgi:hypothetical protein